jgi:hypothetical protein
LLKEIAPQVERVALLFNPITAPYYGYVLNSFNAARIIRQNNIGSHRNEFLGEPIHHRDVECCPANLCANVASLYPSKLSNDHCSMQKAVASEIFPATYGIKTPGDNAPCLMPA